MRMTRLFSQTLREAPSEVEVASHQLLIRAGFIRQLAAGVFSYLPLARRSLDKIRAKVRRAQLYYMRGRQGKAARLKERR